MIYVTDKGRLLTRPEPTLYYIPNTLLAEDPQEVVKAMMVQEGQMTLLLVCEDGNWKGPERAYSELRKFSTVFHPMYIFLRGTEIPNEKQWEVLTPRIVVAIGTEWARDVLQQDYYQKHLPNLLREAKKRWDVDYDITRDAIEHNVSRYVRELHV